MMAAITPQTPLKKLKFIPVEAGRHLKDVISTTEISETSKLLVNLIGYQLKTEPILVMILVY